jgi:hypothetical protein
MLLIDIKTEKIEGYTMPESYMGFIEVVNAKKHGLPVQLWIGGMLVEEGKMEQLTEEFVRINGNIYLTRMVSMAACEWRENRKTMQSVN